MTRIRLLSIAAALLTTFTLGAQTPDQEAAEHARKVVSLLVAERFDEVSAQFNAQMAAALTAAQLKTLWAGLQQKVGPYASIVDERVSRPATGFTAVALGTRFERDTLNVIVAFDTKRKIAGLRIVPRPAASAAPATPPASSRFKEEAVTIGAGEWALPGTLSLPAGPIAAAVVLVHGSGPNDRDETIGPNKPFRDIAWGLADRGIAVLRYEKRTRQHGARMGAKPFTVHEETVEDALLAVSLLRSRKDLAAARLFVLGHSLGGTLAPRIAAQDKKLAGIIVLAGPTRPLQDVIREQVTYLSTLGGGTPAPEASIQALLKQAPESYWKDLDAYKPADVAAKLDIRMLILHGERDYQVSSADLEGWRRALAKRPTVTIKSYPTLNHLFMAGEGKATPADYQRPGTVAPFVLDDIAAWIGKS